jgi:hypothetical protein
MSAVVAFVRCGDSAFLGVGTMNPDQPIFCPPGPHTHSITEVCQLIGCDSQDWFVDRVRNGTFPGRKIVRQLRFSDEDIHRIIEACAVRRVEDVPIPTPTSRSRRRHLA